MKSLDDDNFCIIQAQDKTGSDLGNFGYAGNRGWCIERDRIVTEKNFTDKTIIGNRSVMTGNANQPLGYYYNEQRKLLEFYLNGVSIGSVNII